MIVKKRKKMCAIAHFEGACEETFLSYFVWEKTVNHV